MGNLRNIGREIGAAVTEFAFPPLCAGCEEHVDSGDTICDRCDDSILLLDEPTCLFCDRWLVDKQICTSCDRTIPLFALGQYGGRLERMIVNLKFHGVTAVAEQLSRKFLDLHGSSLAGLDVDAVVPMPLSYWRQYRRGYNQAELIAHEIAVYLDMEIDTTVLRRTGRRKPQSRLRLNERQDNVRGVFRALDHDPLDLLLVDDVVTSGSTVREAVRTLESAGHHVTAVVSLARA